SFFFFQAEDGIRDFNVTGVQTCALPISGAHALKPIASVAASATAAMRQATRRERADVDTLGIVRGNPMGALKRVLRVRIAQMAAFRADFERLARFESQTAPRSIPAAAGSA